MSNVGDNPTTEQLWFLFADKLRSFFLQRVSDPATADDLLQETFLRIHKGLAGGAEVERIRPWVYQIARNLVVDHYRTRPRPSGEPLDEWSNSLEDEQPLDEIVAGWLPRFIAGLPERYREAVELYELHGRSQQAIAEQLGLSLSGAKSRIQRGREQLKAALFQCCRFQLDRRGNVIDFVRNSPSGTSCDTDCGC